MQARLLMLGTALLLSACHDDNEPLPLVDLPSRIEVAPFKQECLGFQPERDCLYVRSEGQHLFHVQHEDIDGFEFSWGMSQDIEVDVTLHENPGPDEPPVEYKLVEVLKSEPVGPQYDFLLPLVAPGQALVPVDVSAGGLVRYKLFDEIGVACELSVCEAYQELADDDNNAVLLRMMFETLEPPLLRIVQVECSAVRDNFPLDCGGRSIP